MRDVAQSAGEVGKRVSSGGEATRPYEAAHWAGQWSEEEPLVSSERVAANAAQKPSSFGDNRRGSHAKAAQKSVRRRKLALAGATVAGGLALVLLALSGSGQFERPPIASGKTASIVRDGAAQALGSSGDGESHAALAQELADARRMVAGLDGQLRSEAARHEQALAQERQRTALLLQQAEAARQELAAAGAQARQSLEQERASAVALANQLVTSRQEGEALAAQLRKAVADSAQAVQPQTPSPAEQEQQRQAALAEAEAARQALAAAEARHRAALEQEQARAAGLAQELATARQESEAAASQLRQAAEARVAQLNAQLQQGEQQKAAAVAEAEVARSALSAANLQHRQLAEQERARAAALAGQLATARQEAEAMAVQLRKAVAEAQQSRQADGEKATHIQRLEQQRAAAVAELEGAKLALAGAGQQHAQALELERARAATLTNQLAASRRDSEALTAQLRKAISEAAQLRQAETARSGQLAQLEQQRTAALAEAETLRQALSTAGGRQRQVVDEERARVASLTEQVAALRLQGEALVAQLNSTRDEAARASRAADAAVAELRQELKQERERSAFRTQDARLASFGVTGPAASANAAAQAPVSAPAEPPNASATAPQRPPAVEAVQPVPVSSSPQASEEAARLVARANALLGQGDIGSARVVLERATEMGSARASFMLAETYDPRILSAWGTYGTRGEVEKARELYGRAQAGGIPEAKERARALE